MSVPPALFHGYHYVEGLTVTIAQSALTDGHWITPYIYNLRWIERPTLLSSIIAALSVPFAHVTPFIARLPIVLSLLTGVYLVWRTLRPVASEPAALLGALLFLACPIVMRYYATSVADLPLAVMLFAAFLSWWDAFAAEKLSVGRWISIGFLLATAALLKGPQPVAFFMLGLASFIVLTSTWRQLPGLLLAGTLAAIPTVLWYAYVFTPGDQSEWLRYTRTSSKEIMRPHPFDRAVNFFFQTFPASFLAAALFPIRARAKQNTTRDNLIQALSCYALACTLVLLFWPAEVNPRYVIPMALPLSVLGGMAYDALAERWPALVASTICIVLVMLGYGAIHSISDSLLMPDYIRSKVDAGQIAELVRKEPAPIYRTAWTAGLNELAYLPDRVTTISPGALSSIPKPAWIVVRNPDAAETIAKGNGRIKQRLALERSVLLRLE
jgi:4-amino-4-deoxy-L-arabinose transferase-like glycosyltransferase